MLTFLFLPRSLFVLEQSWTEPLVLATLGGITILTFKPPSQELWRSGPPATVEEPTAQLEVHRQGGGQ